MNYLFAAETEPHEGKRKVEALWPIFKIHHQKSRYIYDLFYRRKAISRGGLLWLVFECMHAQYDVIGSVISNSYGNNSSDLPSLWNRVVSLKLTFVRVGRKLLTF